MNESAFEQIQACAEYLGIDVYTQEIALFAENNQFAEADLLAIQKTFEYLRGRKQESIVSTLLRMSRLPLKEPKRQKCGLFTRAFNAFCPARS